METNKRKIPAEKFAARYGWRVSAVISRIRAGIYDGVEENGRWYVLRPAKTDPVNITSEPQKKSYQLAQSPSSTLQFRPFRNPFKGRPPQFTSWTYIAIATVHSVGCAMMISGLFAYSLVGPTTVVAFFGPIQALGLVLFFAFDLALKGILWWERRKNVKFDSPSANRRVAAKALGVFQGVVGMAFLTSMVATAVRSAFLPS